ncbi:MAG: MGMT family protein [Oscillospiraceae bacterium]|nr:MGMT family protein [Oscillospiraceae bacterium]
MAKLNDDLIYEILSVVEEIPPGYVASYGQIAALIGRDKNARLVGKVLSLSQYYGQYPCHRVVNHAGRTAPGWYEQQSLLKAEGIIFKKDGCVDMKKHRWQP